MNNVKVEFSGGLLKIGALVAGALGIVVFYIAYPHAPWFGAASYAFVAGLAIDSIIWTITLVVAWRRVHVAIKQVDTISEDEE